MNKRDLEPLPTEVGAMLDTLKPVGAVPIEVRTRLRSRVLVTVGSGGPSGGGAEAPAAASTVPKSALWWLAAGVGLGLAIGIALFSAATTGERASGDGAAAESDRPEEASMPAQVAPAAHTSAQAEASAPVEPSVRLATAHAEVPRAREPIAPVRARERVAVARAPEEEVAARATETAPPHEASTRAEQRAIVERARGALAAGRVADATSALDEHDRRFAGGPYAEESAALRVRVLLAGGRRDEARERAERFLERYPNSIFRDVLGPAL
jgi:hypothetical protein